MTFLSKELTQLEAMGCYVEDWQPIDLSIGIKTNEFWFTYDERLFYTEEVCETIIEQLRFSQEYSICCNVELIDDFRMCPRCKEHC